MLLRDAPRYVAFRRISFCYSNVAMRSFPHRCPQTKCAIEQLRDFAHYNIRNTTRLHPLIPQVMNGTGLLRQFVPKAARHKSRATFGCRAAPIARTAELNRWKSACTHSTEGRRRTIPGSEGVGTKNETRPLSPVASGSPLSLGGVLGDIAINVSWPWLESKSRRAVALRECDSIPAALVLQHLMRQIPLEQPSMY
jgi:hypothetical protein